MFLPLPVALVWFGRGAFPDLRGCVKMQNFVQPLCNYDTASWNFVAFHGEEVALGVKASAVACE